MDTVNALTLSVVIPAYNEQENLPGVLTDLQTTLRQEAIPYEIMVVNDNSTDRTADVVRHRMDEDPCIRTVNRRPPGGFGRAIRSGLEAATGEVLVIYMADASDHPRDVVAYYRKICEGYDCVFGSRFIKGSHVADYPLVKLVVNRIVNKCIQWMFWCKFNDLTNAFKAYRRHVIESIGSLRASHFNITLELSLGALVRKYSVTQIPVSWTGRTWGSSNLRLREMGRRYLSTLLKVLAEKVLISDDILAERVAVQARHEQQSVRGGRQFDALERRVAALEDQLRQMQAAEGPARRAA
jgi:dolichol-phosphate mannosyltransferase